MSDNLNEENERKAQKQLVQKERESVALMEQSIAQKDQLLLQEKEIENLRQEIQSCRQHQLDFGIETSVERRRLREELLTYAQKCRQLEDSRRENEENIGLYKEQNRVLLINYQKLEAKCLELEEDLKRADKQNDSIELIRKDNSSLKTQVLMLTELYQGLKDRFAVINKNATFDEVFAIEAEVRNKELKDAKSKLETTGHQLEALKLKSTEIESQMAKKDQIIGEQKQIIETNRKTHRIQIQIEKQRIDALKKVIQQLEQHILSLYGQLGMREHEQRLREKLDIREEQSSSRMDEESDVDNHSSHNNSIRNNSIVAQNHSHSYTNGNHSQK